MEGSRATGPDGTCARRLNLDKLRAAGNRESMLSVWASHDEYAYNCLFNDRRIRIPPEGQERDVTIQLEPARTIRGRIAGPQPDGADLDIGDARSTEPRNPGTRSQWCIQPSVWKLNPDLTFEIRQAPRLEIRIELYDYSGRFEKAVAIVPPDQDEVTVEMKLNPKWEPRGNVLLVAPRDLSPGAVNFDAYAWCARCADPSQWTPLGEKRIDGILAIRKRHIHPGVHRIIARLDLKGPQGAEPVWYFWESEQNIPQGGTLRVDLEMLPGRPLRVVAVTESGGAPPDAERVWVMVYRVWPDGNETNVSIGRLSESGAFAGRILPPGPCRVRIGGRFSRYAEHVEEVLEGQVEGNVKVVLKPAPEK